jgi:hypothetical protein|tara:strand:+ start:2847 stop:4223 length:1377 start_codon:yes stop_codon:yes gene_type:complete
MAFLKIDTMGMNARYGRTKVAPEKSRQVTEFNTPSKNRAPYIPKTEAKEGDVFSFFDDGKGRVMSSFQGGYQTSATAKVSDKQRRESGLTIDNLSVRGDFLPSVGETFDLGGSVGQGTDAFRYVTWNDLYLSNDLLFKCPGTTGSLIDATNDSGNADLAIEAEDDIHIQSGESGSGGDEIRLSNAGSSDGISVKSGVLEPIDPNTTDLGSDTDYFKHLYIAGNITGKTGNMAITTAGDMTISAAGGDISFDNENLATTGTLASGALTVTGTMSASSTMTAGTVLSVTGAGAADAACIQIANQADLGIWKPAANTIGFTTDDEDAYRMDTVAFYAGTDDSFDLGKSGARFDDVYATNGTIQTSDSRLKESISDSALGLSFLNELRPVQFKFKDKARRHYGLVAQEVEQVLSDSGISTTDFAPLIHDGDSDRYGMRYSEFTSILIKAVQELSKEIEELKK